MRNNRNNRNNNNNRYGSNATSDPFKSIVARAMVTTAAVYQSTFVFTNLQVLADLSGSSRLAQLKSAKFRFNPSENGNLQEIGFQIRGHDIRTGQFIPLTAVIPLSRNRPTVASVRFPNIAMGFQTAASGGNLFDIVLTNNLGVLATAVTESVTIELTFKVSIDVPQIV